MEAAALPAQAVVWANQQVQNLWTRYVAPILPARALALAKQQEGKPLKGPEIVLLKVYDVRTVMGEAPAFTTLATDHLAARFPAAGSWSAETDIRVKVDYRFLFFTFRDELDATVRADGLSADLAVDLDDTDPRNIKVKRVLPPTVHLRISVQGNHPYIRYFASFMTGELNRLASRWVEDAIVQGLPRLQQVVQGLATGQGQPAMGLMGLLAPAAPAGPSTARFHELARNIDDGIFSLHTPHGAIVSLRYAAPWAGTWADALAPGMYQPGTVTGTRGEFGSAQHTGLYLAAQAARYTQTRATGAHTAMSRGLDALGRMLQLKGTPGLLSRELQPVASGTAAGPGQYRVSYSGVDYLVSDGIDRASYAGLFLGATEAWEADSGLRPQAAAVVREAVDYLLVQGWVARDRSGNKAQDWAGAYDQMLACVHAAARTDPARYGPHLAAYRGLADYAWFPWWVDAMEPVHEYPRLVTDHMALTLLARLETDPARWTRILQGQRLLRRAVAGHKNAWFDLLAARADGSQARSLAAPTARVMEDYLGRSRRQTAMDLSNDPATPRRSYAGLYVQVQGWSVQARPRAALTLAADAQLPRRRSNADFIWADHPYHLRRGGDGTVQAPGLDFLLPYWLGRGQGWWR